MKSGRLPASSCRARCGRGARGARGVQAAPCGVHEGAGERHQGLEAASEDTANTKLREMRRDVLEGMEGDGLIFAFEFAGFEEKVKDGAAVEGARLAANPQLVAALRDVQRASICVWIQPPLPSQLVRSWWQRTEPCPASRRPTTRCSRLCQSRMPAWGDRRGPERSEQPAPREGDPGGPVWRLCRAPPGEGAREGAGVGASEGAREGAGGGASRRRASQRRAAAAGVCGVQPGACSQRLPKAWTFSAREAAGRRWAPCSQRRAAGGVQPAECNLRRAVSSGQPVVCSLQPWQCECRCALIRHSAQGRLRGARHRQE